MMMRIFRMCIKEKFVNLQRRNNWNNWNKKDEQSKNFLSGTLNDFSVVQSSTTK